MVLNQYTEMKESNKFKTKEQNHSSKQMVLIWGILPTRSKIVIDDL